MERCFAQSKPPSLPPSIMSLFARRHAWRNNFSAPSYRKDSASYRDFRSTYQGVTISGTYTALKCSQERDSRLTVTGQPAQVYCFLNQKLLNK
ncbi:hypothetical protein RRG08_041414 [Elysia crispata]|uniref:Uncharacterized protein n=1 Tax=Elysia crispata TaxID=231223 RepID=A0AAE0XRC5_9GAST|nr:hypothetical protein RRG08_041414 [Elysia crispata]